MHVSRTIISNEYCGSWPKYSNIGGHQVDKKRLNILINVIILDYNVNTASDISRHECKLLYKIDIVFAHWKETRRWYP